MDEEEIKKLRYSFSNPKEDMMLPTQNQFGHTILGSSGEKKDLSNFELKFSETGEAIAQPKQSVFDNEFLEEWYKKNHQNSIIDDEESVDMEESFKPQNSLISGLISQLEDMSPEIKPQPSTMRIVKKEEVKTYKICSNSECMYSLPLEAKFCMKCGTAQLKKFCTECGYNFTQEEKFCPDCGSKR